MQSQLTPKAENSKAEKSKPRSEKSGSQEAEKPGSGTTSCVAKRTSTAYSQSLSQLQLTPHLLIRDLDEGLANVFPFEHHLQCLGAPSKAAPIF